MSIPVDPQLPKIVRFMGETDGGPCDDGPTAVCPHCGADGRYIQWFKVEGQDGEFGAMRGCIQKFPIHWVANFHKKLCERETELRRKYGNDAHLNSWDTRMMEAVEKFYAGDITEDDLKRTIDREAASKMAWRRRKAAA